MAGKQVKLNIKPLPRAMPKSTIINKGVNQAYVDDAISGAANDLVMAKIGAPDFETIQDMQDTFHSAGCISGGIVSDNGDDTIDVTSAQIYIRAVDDYTSTLYFAVAAATVNLSVPVGTTKYVYIKYNAGSPVFDVSASDAFNNNTEFIGAVVTNEGGTIYIASSPTNVADHAANMIQRLHDVNGIGRNNHLAGNVISEVGTRNIAVTAGELWDRLTLKTQVAFDSSAAGTFNRYYRDGAGGHTVQSAETQWDNTQYDDGTGSLATLGANKFGVQWFYQTGGGAILSVFGTIEHNSEASAEDEGAPSDVAGRVADMSILIGRLIFKKSDATATSLESAFQSDFHGALVTDHNALATLQGGTTAEYYHLTSAEHTNVADIPLKAPLISPAFEGGISAHPSGGSRGFRMVNNDEVVTFGNYIEISLGGASAAGTLTINSSLTNPLFRTAKTYFVSSRYGGWVLTETGTGNGTSGGAAFSVTNPSANIVRVTNDHGSSSATITMNFVGVFGV